MSYNLANCRLLKLLLNEHHLLKRLRSIKRYFLLDQSDFLTSFMDLSLPTLLLPSSQIKVEKLKSLLELVLRNPSSVSYSDPYKDDLYIEMGRRSFFDQLDRITSVVALERNSVDGLDAGLGGGDAAAAAANKPRGVDAIMLGYTVKFPLSLVLDENAIEEYQLLFRYLFQCKYVEYILCKNWIDQGWSRMRGRGGMAASASTPTTPNKGSVRKVVSMSAMMSSSSSSSPTAKTLSLSSSSNKDPQHILMELLEPRMCILRAKMLTFIQQFMYYGCYEVIEPNWRKLEEQLGGGGGESHENMVQSVEQVLSLHRDFLSTCMKECMLSNPKLVKVQKGEM